MAAKRKSKKTSKSKPKPKRAGKKRTRAKTNKIRQPVVWFLKWSLVSAIWGVLAVAIVIGWFAWDLPSTDGLDRQTAQTRRPGIVLLDADGSSLAAFGDLYGRRIGARELPPHLVQAVVAIEDRRFFQHPGVDIRGVARAMVENVRRRRLVQGGSTVTQQLAKNLFLTPERSIERKIKELILAIWLEQRFGKEELLSIYLNRVYFGAGAYGVEAASQRYFGVSAQDLTLYQAALLAGLLKAPSRLNPLHDAAAARQRTNLVLDAMAESGFLTPAEAKGLKQREFTPRRSAVRGPRYNNSQGYFGDWILQQASGMAGRGRDLVVETTLSPRLQNIAARVIAAADTGGAQVALVAMMPNGAVCAMIGGHDYRQSQFNRATQALRQPGSAFKPMVFLPALEAGLTPDTPVIDAPITIDGWTPRNFSGDHAGEISLREAAARSINTTAVRLADDVGRANVLRAARRLGITSQLTTHPSVALGAGEVTLIELTAAYAVFANGGRAVTPFGIGEIRSGDSVLFRHRSAASSRVVASEQVDHMNQLLGAVIDWGTGKQAAFGRRAAGKTGTSQGSRDAWFIGYTDRLVAGVWIGNDDSRPLRGRDGRLLTGGGLPAQIWRDFMRAAHDAPRPGC